MSNHVWFNRRILAVFSCAVRYLARKPWGEAVILIVHLLLLLHVMLAKNLASCVHFRSIKFEDLVKKVFGKRLFAWAFLHVDII